MNNGFMRLHRQLLDWEWFDNSQVLHVWIYCLLKANYQDTKWHGIDIKRGSFVTSLDKICSKTHLSIQNVRTCLGKLKSTGNLTIKVTNKFSIITVCNYDTYNLADELTNKQPNKQPNNQLTNNQQTTNKQLTTSNNNNKEKKLNKEKKEDNNILFDSNTEKYPFDVWWNIYDKKSGRKDCEKKWSKISDKDKEIIMEHTPKYVLSTPDKQYRKLPLTYLNGEHWNDEIRMPKDFGYVDYKREQGRFDSTIAMIEEWNDNN